MHPQDAGMWVLAGKRAANGGDINGARGYFMRGCRFCVKTEVLWVEYAKAEMEWLARVEAKARKGTANSRGVGALEEVRAAEVEEEGDVVLFDEESGDDDEDLVEGGPIIAGPDADLRKETQRALSTEEAQKLQKSPALEGAIPKAIFDISKKQPFFGPQAAEAFFDVFSGFPNVSSQPGLAQHVLDSLVELYPNHPSTANCLVRHPLIGREAHSPGFPRALRESLARLKTHMETTTDKMALSEKTIAWIDPILGIDDLDTGIRTVLEYTRQKLQAS
jgi:U3 small nucleolar RNA-associated protein 6